MKSVSSNNNTINVITNRPFFLTLQENQPVSLTNLTNALASKKEHRYRLQWRQELFGYFVNIFIGNGNQRVNMMLDTTLNQMVFPSNCCIDPQCLYRLGVYFFNQSESCLVKKTNGARVPCYNYTCGTIAYTQTAQDLEDEIGDFGLVKRVEVEDYVSFDPLDTTRIQTEGLKRIPLNIVMDIILGRAGIPLPPVLGLGPRNPLGIREFAVNLKKKNKEELILNPKGKPMLWLQKSVRFPYGAMMRYSGGMVDCRFDLGYQGIALPTTVYQMVRRYIVSNGNILEGSPLWRGEAVQVRRNEEIKVPDLVFEFPTQGPNGVWRMHLKKEDYMAWVGDYEWILLIEEARDGREMVVGNCGMRRKEIWFSLVNGIGIN